MVMIGLIGLLCGALLGGRYRIFVLIPAHMLAAIVVVLAAAGSDHQTADIVSALVVWSVTCNVGYVLGAILGASRRRARVQARRVLPTSSHLRR